MRHPQRLGWFRWATCRGDHDVIPRRWSKRRLVIDRLEARTLLAAFLDTSFGVGGKATVPFDLAEAGGYDTAIQADGKIVVVGEFGGFPGPGNADFLIARYTASGHLDPTFSGDGIASVSFFPGGTSREVAQGVTLQSDGKIVVVGSVQQAAGDYDFGIVRLNANGTLDTSFSGDGRQLVSFNLGGSDSDLANDVLIDGSGRIVVAGTVDRAAGGDTDVGVARLRSNGDLDPDFNPRGLVGRTWYSFNRGPVGNRLDTGEAIAIQADQKLVVGATVQMSDTDYDFGVVRLNTNGTVDTATFQASGPYPGTQTVAFNLLGGPLTDKLSDLAVHGSTIVLGGTAARAGGNRDFAAARLLSNGTLDPGFSGDGKAMVAFDQVAGGADVCNALAVQSDGAILLVGQVATPSDGFDFGVARLTAAGAIDSTFNPIGATFGRQTVGFNLGGSNLDTANAVAIQPDGRIVVVGQAFKIFVAMMFDPVALTRLNANGTIDTTFGTTGRMAESYGFSNGVASSMVMQPDGKAILAGSVIHDGNMDFAVARVWANGTLDTSFGGTGVVTIPFDRGGTNADRANGVAIQSDGKIVVVGSADTGVATATDMAIARLLPNGDLDPDFGFVGAGRRIIPFDDMASPSRDEAFAVAIQSSGHILVGGTVDNAVRVDFTVLRLNPNGQLLDTTFNSTGTVRGVQFVDFAGGGTNADRCRALALQPDGKILLAGSVDRGGGNYDFGVARVLTDGRLDTTFDGDGKRTISFNLGGPNADHARALALQPDGKILVVGDASMNATGDIDFAIARLNLSNGSLDPTFSGDGKQTVRFNLGGSNADRPSSVIVRDNRIVMAGVAEVASPGGPDIAIARLRLDGSLDGSFAPNGRYTVPMNLGGNNTDAAVAVAALSSNRLLVAGTSATDSPVGGTIPTMVRLLTPAGQVEGDYDGDGRTDLALYHHDAATNRGLFEIRRSSSAAIMIPIAGVGPRVIPVAGDFDGDGKTDVAVVDPLGSITPGASTWVILLSGSGGLRREVAFGATGTLDRPAPADFDGDGITDIATFRANSDLTPGAAEWFILPSIPNPGGYPTRNGAFRVAFGAPGGADLPAPADFDGDGKADIAAFRPIPTPQDVARGVREVAQWFVLPSGPNDATFSGRIGGFRVEFGAASNRDQPVPADFDGDRRADIAAFRSNSDLVPGSAQWFILPSIPNDATFSGRIGGYDVTFGVAGEIAAVGDVTRDGRPDLVLHNRTTGVWRLRSGTTGMLLPSITFGSTGPRVVPVLAPLFFRLLATSNIPLPVTAALQTSDGLASVVDRAIEEWVNPLVLG
ncbi:FG-GAP-like repeat-containing protein [Tautonia marina]|uniref:FG-GAP-like repeat-containing protein n=1 Tax=Tautonia marina TaxID=2653855 RepID=UPI0012604EE7|nr:FG-GAP-like repeat-containing protein [Tautonia marina]